MPWRRTPLPQEPGSMRTSVFFHGREKKLPWQGEIALLFSLAR